MPSDLPHVIYGFIIQIQIQVTSQGESVNPRNLDSTNYGCEICLVSLLLKYTGSLSNVWREMFGEG